MTLQTSRANDCAKESFLNAELDSRNPSREILLSAVLLSDCLIPELDSSLPLQFYFEFHFSVEDIFYTDGFCYEIFLYISGGWIGFSFFFCEVYKVSKDIRLSAPEISIARFRARLEIKIDNCARSAGGILKKRIYREPRGLGFDSMQTRQQKRSIIRRRDEEIVGCCGAYPSILLLQFRTMIPIMHAQRRSRYAALPDKN